MKILYTLFTPPFVQVVSSSEKGETGPERKYLEYSDWYSNLRRLSAGRDTVKLVSLTKHKKRFSIDQGGYETVFFPVTNPDEKVKNGRWDFFAQGLVDWVIDYDPDVIHIVGTGHLMALEIMRVAGFADRSCVWLRGATQDHVFEQEEPHLSRFFVLPTEAAVGDAQRYMPAEKLVALPLGANVDLFRPDPGAVKSFDVISVGGSANKQIGVVREIVRKNNLSWLHVGKVIKGWPFSRWEDFLFFNSIRRKLGLRRVKVAGSYPHTCGFFPNSMMPELYNSARVLVHPSLAEGAPRCVQEAIACGVPAVVLKDTVPYVEPDFGVACIDHSGFEAAVMGLLAYPERRGELARRGRDWLVENHSPERLYAEVAALNEKIVSGGLRRRDPEKAGMKR
jgi:glycosyltransferase involved in cell wall biosynthesis